MTMPFCISKGLVWKAYLEVKSNKGGSGIDRQSIEDFSKDLKNNLYKLWSRMSSGSYFPKATRTVIIPKKNGGERLLGIPTVTDRIAQTVVKLNFEKQLERIFHEDSYGYRANKSAVEAIGVARQRCWKYRWVIDLDIKGFFDNIDHDLLLKAVEKNCNQKWEILYIKRWLTAPSTDQTGKEIPRMKGTPQGGVISPLLANLFLNYAFDWWITKKFPQIKFERYADDIVVHCESRSEAEKVKNAIQNRLAECKLELHPDKTKIVYCQNHGGPKIFKEIKFDFLGYCFRPRSVINSRTKTRFVGFTPAISAVSGKKIREAIRSWKLSLWTSTEMPEIATKINPIVQGWINYFGAFNKSSLIPILRHIDLHLLKWVKRKYRRIGNYIKRSKKWLGRYTKYNRHLFTHWKFGIGFSAE